MRKTSRIPRATPTSLWTVEGTAIRGLTTLAKTTTAADQPTRVRTREKISRIIDPLMSSRCDRQS